MGRRRRPRDGGGKVEPSRSDWQQLGYGSSFHPTGGLAKDAEQPRGDTLVRATKAIRRNDPCPCGSGRKFKKCCLS